MKKSSQSILILALLVMMVFVVGCVPKAPVQDDQTAENTNEEQPQEIPSQQQEQPKKPEYKGPVTEVSAALSEWKIVLNKKEVNAGHIKFMVTNAGPRWPHAMRVVNTATGKSVGDQVSVNLDEVDSVIIELEAGTYEIYDPLSGNKEKGMTTTLVVH
ncbi:MAG: hypothetical protein AABX72_04605 [Nanoarchaeota archaeon]